MTLSMTLGMWMMAGELVGVGLVVVLTQIGVAAILLTYPALFIAFKWGGGLYLAYLGYASVDFNKVVPMTSVMIANAKYIYAMLFCYPNIF